MGIVRAERSEVLRLRHIADRRGRADVDCGIAHDLGLVAASVDVANGAERGCLLGICFRGVAVNVCLAVRLVDVHNGIAVEDGRIAQTAAIYFADVGEGDDVQHGVVVELCAARLASLVVVVAIDGVWGQVASEVEFVDADGTASRLLDVQLDVPLDDAATVVAAEQLAELAAGDGQLHVAMNVGIVGTAVYLVYLCLGHTAQHEDDVALYVGILACADQLQHVQVAVASGSRVQVSRALYGSPLVAAAVGLVDEAALQRDVCVALDVGTGIVRPCGAAVYCPRVLAVTSAEDVLQLVSAVDQHFRPGHGSSIAAAIDALHADVARHNPDECRLAGCRIVGQVAAAIDGCHLVGTLHVVTSLGSRLFIIPLRPRSIALDCLIDRHRDVAQGVAVQVVAAKHASALHHVGMIACIISYPEGRSRASSFAAKIHTDIAINQGLHSCDSVCCRGLDG